MAFDQKYYDDKKAKLNSRFTGNKDKLITSLEELVHNYQIEQNELSADFRAINEMEEEYKKTLPVEENAKAEPVAQMTEVKKVKSK